MVTLLILIVIYLSKSSGNSESNSYDIESGYESEDESYTDEYNQYPLYSDDYDDEYSSRYDNYVETSSCEDGVVVYEGRGDYYIIETGSGHTVLETYSGILVSVSALTPCRFVVLSIYQAMTSDT